MYNTHKPNLRRLRRLW